MTPAEIEALLKTCHRDALVDHAFGDSEVDWILDGKRVAAGYFSNRDSEIAAVDGSWEVEGQDARKLQYCGLTNSTTRNDAGDPRDR